jgi:membrane protease YdiL (CAAX protease family)
MLSRGFTFGVLLRFGRFKALVISSFLFGLLHINVYIPGHLGWDTYYHVISAFGMGMILCALMMVTRSIWVSVLFHAMMDWHIPFTAADTSGGDSVHYSLWENLSGPMSGLIFDCVIVLVLLAIDAVRITPARWMHRLAVRWKLVEPVIVT